MRPLTHLPLVAALLAALAAAPAAADEIRVLNWQGYGTDIDWSLAEFEGATGHTVVHEAFTSEQEMLTKLRTDPGAYDVVLVNSAYLRQAAAEGLVGPIDPALLPNLADVDPAFVANPEVTIDGALMGVPWTWGLTALAVSTDDFAEPPTSIEVLWDPAYQGRVSIRDDALEAVQLGALATGQSINDVQDLGAVRARLEALLPQVSAFWSSENDWNQAMASGEVAVATYWSGSAARSISKGLPIAFVVPEEGAIGWLDTLAVPAASTGREAAHAFIDWMLDPDFYVRWEAEGAPASANVAAAAGLPEESLNRRVLGDPAVIARVQFLAPVPDERREEYLALWQDLKAAQ